MSLNMLRNDLNHSTTSIVNNNNNKNNNKNDNIIATTIAIDFLVILVKQCSIKPLLLTSNTLLIKLSCRGSGNACCRMMSHRAFEETEMTTTIGTNDDADVDSKNKENKLCFQLVIDYLSSSLSIESKLPVSNLDSDSHITDVTAPTTVEPDVYCETTLEAWTSLKGIDSNENDNTPSLNHK